MYVFYNIRILALLNHTLGPDLSPEPQTHTRTRNPGGADPGAAGVDELQGRLRRRPSHLALQLRQRHSGAPSGLGAPPIRLHLAHLLRPPKGNDLLIIDTSSAMDNYDVHPTKPPNAQHPEIHDCSTRNALRIPAASRHPRRTVNPAPWLRRLLLLLLYQPCAFEK